MIAALLLLLLGQGAPVAAKALPDHELAEQRGGFRLPSGIDVALTVQTQTAIDGAIVLRTVFRADEGAPTLTVSTPRPGETVVAQGGGAPATVNSGTLVVSYDPRSGIQVTQGMTVPTVNVTSGGASAAVVGSPDLQQVDVSGAGVATDAGQVTAARSGGLDTVRLTAADLVVTHFTGNAFGSAIANSGSDRAIDTQTTVSIDLSNTTSDVVNSAMLRVEDLASAVGVMLVR